MRRHSLVAPLVLAAAASLVACSGGGGGSSSPAAAPYVPAATVAPGAAPTATPTPGVAAVSTAPAFSASDAIVVPSAAPAAASVPVPLPSDPGGAAASFAFNAAAAVAADTTIDATYQSAPDASLPLLDVRRAPLSRNLRDNDQPHKGVVYLRLRFSTDVTFPQIPAFSFVVPGTLSTNGVAYWLAFFDPLKPTAGWQLSFEGPATVKPATTAAGAPATSLAFASVNVPLTLLANQTYWLAVVAVSNTVSSPTPVPSALPTRTPEPKPSPVVASPSALIFPTVASSPQSVTFTQAGNTGGIVLRGSCTGIVNTGGASPTFAITPVGAGACKLVGLGDRGASAVVNVYVATATPSPRPSSSASPKPSEAPEPPRLSPLPFVSSSPAPSSSPSAKASPQSDDTPKPSPSPSSSASPAGRI